MNKDCSQSTLRAHTSSSRAHASSSFPTLFDPASPALFFTRTRVLTSKEHQSIFQDWGSDAGPIVRGLDGQWSKKRMLAQGTSIPVRFDARVVPSRSCTTRIHYVGTTSGRVVAREDRLAGTAFHPAPVTDGCKRPRSPKPPTSPCIKPRPVCSPPLKAYSPVREGALPGVRLLVVEVHIQWGKVGATLLARMTNNCTNVTRRLHVVDIWVTFKNVGKATMLKLRWSDRTHPQRLEVPGLRRTLLYVSRSKLL